MDLSCRLEIDLFEKRMASDERNIFADEFGDLIQVFYFFWFTKHHRISLESCSSGSTDTMDVYFWFERYVIDDHMRKFIDIYTSRSNIRRDEDTDSTTLEIC